MAPKKTSPEHYFGVDDKQTVVLVEFAKSVTPASPAFTEDHQKRLIKDCKLKIIPFEMKEASPAMAALSPDRYFLEVESEDARKPLDIIDNIEKVFKEEVVTIIPVPSAIPAIAPQSAEPASGALPTPDLHMLQGYAGSAPEGLGFSDIAILEGADGAGVTIIDLEGGWNLAHEALTPVQFNLWVGEASQHSGWVEHGTAVSSVMLSARDGIGISGLVPGARGALASIYTGTPRRQRISQQIDACRNLLSAGDVLLLEVQRPGPATNFISAADQHGYLPTSFWPDVKESIRACIADGIVVVEVAGNGGVDLDDESLQGAFDQTGSTITTLGAADSGSILVGAGHAPNAAPHGDGDNQGVPLARSRIGFSNYGKRLDCQAWGEGVVSAGYGDAWGELGSNNAYSGRFFGTSSAGPIIAAAVAATQGRHLYKYGQPVPPLLLRQVFASFGTPQQRAEDDKLYIGPQPDLPMIFSALGLW
ncbi:MAG: S8 family serine peptidase [Porticoccus sp.]|nr:S8 family serine peptidase [Porticoccus sp.]